MEAPALNVVVELTPGAPIDLTSCPKTRAVAVFEAEGGRPVLILSTARLRDAIQRRLGPDEAPNAPSRSADLRPVVRRVRAASAYSVFETDLLFLRLAHAMMPATFRAVMDRRRGWFVHIDAREQFPRFTVVPTSAMPGSVPAGGELIGPVLDKHAAQRLTQTLEDLFDLCRFHHILVKSPDAAPCAYKELGKCPAPCDGSESLDAYRSRIAEAIAFVRDPVRAEAARTSQMEIAAQSQDFEAAQRQKAWLDNAQSIQSNHRTRHALGDWRRGWAVIASGSAPDRPRAFIIGPTGVSVTHEPDADQLAHACARPAVERPTDEFTAAAIGLVCDALHRAPRRTERIIALHAPDAADQIRAAIRALSRDSAPADDDPEERDTEFTAEPTP